VTTNDALSLLRRGILVLLAIGAGGLMAEFVLLEHYVSAPQYIPFGLLGVTLLVISWHWLAGTKRSVRAFQAMMMLLVIAGPVGMGLHLRGNFRVVRDLDPSVAGTDLWLAMIRGRAPMLDPGSLMLFGLFGLLFAYRHPALSDPEA
jgi:hypothetical protein